MKTSQRILLASLLMLPCTHFAQEPGVLAEFDFEHPTGLSLVYPPLGG